VPVFIAKAVRYHWAVENNLHWMQVVIFKEDDSRLREDYAAENVVIMRHLALNMLKKEPTKEIFRDKRLRTGWNQYFLISILSVNSFIARLHW
jgi:hypothetical protein